MSKIRISIENNANPTDIVRYDEQLRAELLDYPVLRIYSMSPTAIVLGIRQGPEYFDRKKIHKDGYAFIKRTTSGWAVMCGPKDVGISIITKCKKGEQPEVYKFWNEIISDVFVDLGIGRHIKQTDYPTYSNLQCFSGGVPADLIDDKDRKFFAAVYRSREYAPGEYSFLYHAMAPATLEHRRIHEYIKDGTVDKLAETGCLEMYGITRDDVIPLILERVYEHFDFELNAFTDDDFSTMGDKYLQLDLSDGRNS